MVYEVPPSRASIRQNQFRFTLQGSKKQWSLPLQQFLPADIAYEIGQAVSRIQGAQAAGQKPADSDALALSVIQHDLIERYCPGLYALVDDEQLQGIIVAWGEASTVTLGESQASAAS